jgi:hypothetical protein
LDNFQVICHGSILHTSKTIQIRENIVKDLNPIPFVMPEPNFGAISQLKYSMTRKLLPTPPNILPQTHPIQPMNLIGTLSAPQTTIFRIRYNSPQGLSLMQIAPKPFFKKSTIKILKDFPSARVGTCQHLVCFYDVSLLSLLVIEDSLFELVLC